MTIHYKKFEVECQTPLGAVSHSGLLHGEEGGTNETRISTKGSNHNRSVLDGSEGVLDESLLGGLEDEVAELRDGSTDADNRGVEGGAHGGESNTEPLTNGGDGLHSGLIASEGEVADLLAGGELAIGDEAVVLVEEGTAGAVGLEGSLDLSVGGATVSVDDDVTDALGHVGGSHVGLAVDDETAAEAGAEGDA